MKHARVLLVEPDYRSSYPPLGLMKLASYYRAKGDEVRFVRGCDQDAAGDYWDRIFITSLFTYDWSKVEKAVHFYRDNLFGVAVGKVQVGGIAATLLADRLFNETGLYPVRGPLLTARLLGEDDDTVVDELVPDYSILDQVQHAYRYGRSFMARTTRGCIRSCKFCAIDQLEPDRCDLIDIKPVVEGIRSQIGDQPELVLMDNNVLASPRLADIVDDIMSLGFQRGAKVGKRQREVDFNQGLDARLLTKESVALIAQLPLKPVRIAYDRARDHETFERAVRLIAAAGFRDISNYLLYNFDDRPEELWERMHHCVELGDKLGVRVWSFPMRYVPIADTVRDYVGSRWNRRLLRGVQCVSLVTRGVVSARKDFFLKAFGRSPEEFIEILSMPDRYIIQRSDHAGNGAVEWRRAFRSLSPEERESMWSLTSGNRRKDLATAYEGAALGRVRDVLSHYVMEDKT